ncbi:MAG: MATE family efflux transporter [Turicibacter sp.]
MITFKLKHQVPKNTTRIDQSHYLFSNMDLFKLFIPLIIEQFLGYLVGLVDSIMVSHVGEAAVSGVSLVDFLMQLLISLFAALATGGAVVAGQFLGNKDGEQAKKTTNQLIWFAGLTSVGMMVFIYLIKPIILNVLFGQITAEVYENANTYFMIVVSSIPFLALYNVGAAIFRTTGNSKLPMQIMFAMNILNVIGNAIFIYGLEMGVAGIAIPTLVSRMLAAVLMVALLLNQKYELHLKKCLTHTFDWAMIKRILHIGVPYGLENGLFYFGRIVVLSLVSTFGTVAIASNSVAGTISTFTTMTGMAINLGMTAIISRCVGSGDYEQVKYYHKKIMLIVYATHFVTNTAIIMLLQFILNVYNLSVETSALTYQIVLWNAIMSVIIWPLAYTQPVTFRATGDAKYPMMIATTTMFLCRIVMAYVLGSYLGFGLFGTFIAMFLDWIVKAIIFTVHYLRGKWMKYKLL